MLSVKVIPVKGIEYGLHVNHFYNYHHECYTEFLVLLSSGVLLHCSLTPPSSHSGGALQTLFLEFKT